MKRFTKYWVRFYTPGSFTADSWTKDIDEGTRPEDIEWPDEAYAFRVYRQRVLEDEGGTYHTDPETVGPLYYHPDSKIETLEEVKANPNATRVLISNMECNRWDRVIWTRWGNWPQPFDDDFMKVL